MSKEEQHTKSLVREAIYEAAVHLDDQYWNAWIDQCAEDFKYSVVTYSYEDRKDLSYLILSHKELHPYFDLLPKHNSDHSPLRRHASIYTVHVSEDGKSADAVTSFLMTQEMIDGISAPLYAGENRLYLTGKYYDKFRIDGESVKFTERVARVYTRRFDKGTHWVI